MGYLRGFIPWIVAGFVSSFDWRWGAVAALITGLALLLQDRRRGVAMDALVLDISTVVYFVLLTIFSFAFPTSPLEHYSSLSSFSWLALTAWGSLAIRQPFTLGIARRRTPREFWDMPEFVQVNVVITIVWAAAFTLLAISLGVCTALDAPVAFAIVFHIVGLAWPIIFTAVYPARAQRKLAAAGGMPAQHSQATTR
jgi:hypothetical protein